MLRWIGTIVDIDMPLTRINHDPASDLFCLCSMQLQAASATRPRLLAPLRSMLLTLPAGSKELIDSYAIF